MSHIYRGFHEPRVVKVPRRLKVDPEAIGAAVDWLAEQDFPPDAGERIRAEAWRYHSLSKEDKEDLLLLAIALGALAGLVLIGWLA